MGRDVINPHMEEGYSNRKEWGDKCYLLRDRYEGYAGSRMPNNGEFKVGRGSPCGSLGGSRPMYTRTGYLGDEYSCCTTQPSSHMVGGKTCDPEYWDGPSAPACKNSFSRHCSKGDNIVSDGDCSVWANTNPDLADPVMATYCDLHPLSEDCVEWAETSDAREASHRSSVRQYASPEVLSKEPEARALCQKYRGGCNVSAQKYCDLEGADKGFCACLNSPVRRFNAECMDKDCAQKGYKMNEDPPTCNITSCEMVYDMQDIGGNVTFTDNVNDMSCGERPKDEDDDISEGDKGDGAGTPPTGDTWNITNWMPDDEESFGDWAWDKDAPRNEWYKQPGTYIITGVVLSLLTTPLGFIFPIIGLSILALIILLSWAKRIRGAYSGYEPFPTPLDEVDSNSFEEYLVTSSDDDMEDELLRWESKEVIALAEGGG